MKQILFHFVTNLFDLPIQLGNFSNVILNMQQETNPTYIDTYILNTFEFSKLVSGSILVYLEWYSYYGVCHLSIGGIAVV